MSGLYCLDEPCRNSAYMGNLYEPLTRDRHYYRALAALRITTNSVRQMCADRRRS